ncbi:MAG: choice-of-anchor L domain-containing protein [Bacteroidota bacterium]
MNTLLRKASLWIGIMFLLCKLPAQIQITDSLTTSQLLQDLFGPGVMVSNLTVSADSQAIGAFDGTASNIGLHAGIVMSTGKVTSIADTFSGPGNGATSTGFGLPGDPDLTQLSGIQTYDACIIEFDLASICDTIVIRYVFGSEEYPEFAPPNISAFNDIFAFLIDGPGYSGPTNIAMIPGTTQAVSINNVNPVTNAQLYQSNSAPPFSHGFDGFTVPLTAYALVQPDSLYHIKLTIADAADHVFDSGIFLQREGICANPGLISMQVDGSQSSNLQLAEDSSVNITLRQALSSDTDQYIHVSVGGTAVAGIDFVPLPDSILLAAGESSVSFPLSLLPDCEAEGMESIEIIYSDADLLCDGSMYSDTIVLQILDGPVPEAIELGPDTLVCSGEVLSIGVPAEPDMSYLWSSSSGLSNTHASMVDFQAINDSLDQEIFFSHILTATNNQGCAVQDTIIIGVSPEISLLSNAISDSLCVGESVLFDLQFAYVDSWAWDFGDGNMSSEPLPSHVYVDTGMYEVRVLLNNDACELADSFMVEINSCIPTSIGDESTNFLSVYPNPVSTTLVIDLTSGISGDLTLLNLHGQSIWQMMEVQEQVQMNVSEWEEGVYVLKLVQKGKPSFYERIIVQH